MGKLIGLLALLVVNLSTVALAECPPYDRKDYRHWIDADGDCQNARHEVLIEESLEPVTYKDQGNCKVATGLWRGPYTGELIRDASKLDIDHLIPLKEAHESGGFAWSNERRSQFANDLSSPESLVATTARANRSKGAKDPSEWLPKDETFYREYARAWIAVKLKWGLTADAAEIAVLRQILGTEAEMPIEAEECSGSINPFSAKLPVARVDCSAKKYCKDMSICDEAKAYLIQCGMKNLDRDGDGVPCEALCD
jgi:hypothetical protein